jgi:hypothetical protein
VILLVTFTIKQFPAILYITKKYFTATGDLESHITDAATRNIIDTKIYSAQFNWQQEYATYTGDSRAITSNDLFILSNNNSQVPEKLDLQCGKVVII